MAETKKLTAEDVTLPDGFTVTGIEPEDIGEQVVEYVVVRSDTPFVYHVANMAENRVLLEGDTLLVGEVDAEQELSEADAMMRGLDTADLEQIDDSTYRYTLKEAAAFLSDEDGNVTEGLFSMDGATAQDVLDELASMVEAGEEETVTVLDATE